MKIYQIGGAVRDRIMGKKPQDIDYVVIGANVDQMINMGFKQVGQNFPVFIHPETGYEYALARKEVKTGNKHTDFEFIFTPDISLEEDSQRRDFTCNALAFDENTNQIIDYHGGIDDIKQKILRHINDVHFIEDPLRVLRLCRFCAQLDFKPADETLYLVKTMVKGGMLKHLTPERIWLEILKGLKSYRFDKFIVTAKECGALKVILPEVDLLFDTPERKDYHPEGNSGAHTILCLKNVSQSSALVKFAVLLHDIGKILTPKEILPSHHGHDNAGLELIKNICNRLKIPNIYKKFALICCEYHMKLHLIRKMKAGTLVDIIDAFKNYNLNDFLEVARADFLGRNRHISKEERLNFLKDVSFILQINKFLKSLKPTDMPNFKTLPKDKNFAERYRQFRIEKLKAKFSLC